MNNNCKNPIFVFIAVQAFLLLLHGCFLYYLFCRYGDSFKHGQQQGNGNPNDDKSVWQKVTHILCMDCGVFLYFFIFIFQIVWSILGSSWLGSDTAQCKDLQAVSFAWIMLTLFWAWLVIGLIIGFFTLIFMALDEGSCSCVSLCYCCIACLTCGVCSPKVSQKSKEKRRLQRQKSGGVGTGVLRFFGFGCGGGSKKHNNNNYNGNNNNYNANNNNYNTNNNNYNANNNNNFGNQGYPPQGGYNGGNSQNPNYNYPPAQQQQPQPQKKKGFFGKFFGKF